jgi:hypothetical protein
MLPSYILVACPEEGSITLLRKVSLYASLLCTSGCLHDVLIVPEEGSITFLRNVSQPLCFLMSLLACMTYSLILKKEALRYSET